MDAPTAPPRARRRRPEVVVVAVLVLLVGLAVVGGGLAMRGAPVASASPAPSVTPPPSLPAVGAASIGYLVRPGDLSDRAQQASAGTEPLATARADLIEDADAALETSARPMVNLDIPGTEGPFVDDTASAYGLALAYAVTGDTRYAQGARDYIMAWVDTTETLVNACPEHGGCQTSLIVARTVPGLVFAADLIRPSKLLTAEDDAAFRTWLADLILPELPTRDGNWGDAGDFSRAAITDYLGDEEGFANALDEWRSRMDAVPSDGHLPDEVRRGEAGMSYTQEALQYKVAVARLAELRGVDLWSYVGKGGASLRTAVDLLTTYWSRPEDWPWDTHVSVPSPNPMWEIAYQHWQDPAWPPIFAEDRPYGGDGHSAIRWTTMTNGIPLP